MPRNKPTRPSSPITAAEPDPTLDDLWASILTKRYPVETLEPGEKTIEMVANELNTSLKMAGYLLLQREKQGLLTSRMVRLDQTKHKVKAYLPVVKS